METKEMEAEERTEEEVRELLWEKYFPRIKMCGVFNFVISLILFAIMIISVPLFTEWLRDESYQYLGYELIFILIVSFANAVLVLIGGKKTRLDIVWWLAIADCFLTVIIFILFKKEIGSHTSSYEAKAFRLLLVEMIIQILTVLGISLSYKEIRVD